MPRAAWITDIHLNFVKPDKHREFLDAVRREKPDQIWLGGDTGESETLTSYLTELAEALKVPIYFVLGNHDYYNNSFGGVQASVRDLVDRSKVLHWMPLEGLVKLAPGVGLIGHGGWADGRYGDFAHSTVLLNDYLTIADFKALLGPEVEGLPAPIMERMQASAPARLAKLNALGDASAAWLKQHLPAAAKSCSRLYVLTHVPPFKEACWYEGKQSDDNYLPHFSNKVFGDVLREVAQAQPECRMTVLCGHTHGEGRVQILPNLEVLTGGATYGAPYVQQCFEW
ncbi:MAG TPA: metallophosphoesterase [Planctomycetota bacterium]|nr:metallophosphoesterase [Planctomycetota bacterium]